MKKERLFNECLKIAKWFTFSVSVIGISGLISTCKTDQTDSINQLDGLKVPDGFSIERVVAADMLTYPMFATFDGQGRLYVFESDGSSPSTEDMINNPSYFIRVLEDTNGDGNFNQGKIFADSLTFPKGGVFYQGSLYVAASPDLLRLTDTDGDGVADKREVILSGWKLNHNGAILGGPFFGPDGWMYITDARRGFDISTKEGINLKGKSARIWRCKPDGTGLESMSGGGYDNAIELIFMPSGETIGTMTYFIDPQGGMRDALMHWVEGGVYPKPHGVIAEDHLKLTGDLMPVMTKMARVAPSGLVRYRGNAFGEEYTGNLFSAEFNTGRIMRYQINTDEATYKTVDKPFITSTVDDIHLTDVLEDADGSLLVLNTGGWFITGCPLSVEAKRNVFGGIYRIKKNGSHKVEDAWGHKLSLSSISAERLVEHISDPRTAVRDQVIERLVEIGAPAVNAIKGAILTSENPAIRASGVFALYRINSPEALKEVRSALDDSSTMVRVAATRVLGLSRNQEAVDKLIEIVQNDNPSAQRQAATALGQIGDKRAVSALLKTSEVSRHRLVEHAIIYALINLKAARPLKDALTHASYNVRKTALIALDQMDGAPLHKSELVPFLESEHRILWETGIWVAAHHPDWADITIQFLQTRLNNTELSETDASQLRELMITFSMHESLQNYIGTQLGSTATPIDTKVFLIDVISHSPVKEIPMVWVRPLGKILQEDNPALRSLVLGLIESRRITPLSDQLKLIVSNPNTAANFRLKALSTLLHSEASISSSEYQMVLQYLDKENESPVRQLAAAVLASAKLNDNQLLQLANEQVSQADVFLLPNLVSTFEGNSSAVVGEALVTALQSSSNRLDHLSEQELQRLFHNFPQAVKTSAEPLVASVRAKNAARLSNLQLIESQLSKGDVMKGRHLFFGKAICSSCHAVGDRGGDFGPDLTNIGEIRSKHDILEAIMYPEATFAREHETSKVTTEITSYTGIIKEQLDEAIIMQIAPGQSVRIQSEDIREIEPQITSMMPPGLDKLLTLEEISDLMAYLVSLPDGMGGIGRLNGNKHQ